MHAKIQLSILCFEYKHTNKPQQTRLVSPHPFRRGKKIELELTKSVRANSIGSKQMNSALYELEPDINIHKY